MRAGVGIVLLAVCLAPPIAADGGLTRTIDLAGESRVALLEQSDAGLTFEVTVGELIATEVETPGGTFTALSIPGYHRSFEIGDPALPMMRRLIEVPYGASATVEILESETRQVCLSDYGLTHPLLPAQESLSKSADPAARPFRINAERYLPGAEASRALVAVEDLGQLRGAHVGRVDVAPVSYRADEGTLTVQERVRFRVHFAGADLVQEAYLKASTASPFFNVVYDRLAGARTAHTDNPDLMAGPVTYAIVSDPMFEAQLQPFIAWKQEQGFRVIEAYTDDPSVGTSATSIQSYIHDLYNNATPSDPAPTFVLFVGDVSAIPYWNLSGPSDLRYCDVNNDYLPEMYYGRFSANSTSDLQPQIDKTLVYEQCTMPDLSYLGRSQLIAGVDATYAATFGNGQINYGANNYFNAAHGVTCLKYLYPQSGSQSTQIRQDVSDGVAISNYCAHGSTGGWSNPIFTSTMVGVLQNYGKYCLAIGNCCDTSTFTVTTCFAEKWLRVEDIGGIGYIGAANSSYWNEDYYWSVGYGPVIAGGATYAQTGYGAYDGMFHDHGEAIDQWYVVQDAIVFCGNLGVTESGSYLKNYYWSVYNLMGDPSLSPYLRVPDANAVSHDLAILGGDGESTLFHVTAEPNSYVGLTKDGVLIGGDLVGASGSADIAVSGQGFSGEAGLVVTCQNKLPYFATVPIGDASSVAGMTPVVSTLRIAPNPTRGAAQIALDLPRSDRVTLTILDLNGRLVRTLAQGQLPAGQHVYSWDGRDAAGRPVASGVYLTRLNDGRETRLGKTILSR